MHLQQQQEQPSYGTIIDDHRKDTKDTGIIKVGVSDDVDFSEAPPSGGVFFFPGYLFGGKFRLFSGVLASSSPPTNMKQLKIAILEPVVR